MRLKIIILLIGFFFISIHVASALSEGMCINAEITSIEPSSVDANEDFTVGIQIDNCGEILPDNITFEITRHSQDIEIKEPLVNYIGEMGYSNSKRFILYHMRSSLDATPGEHVFETKLSYGKGDFSMVKEGSFSITVSSKEPELSLSRVATEPEIPTTKDKTILTIDIENAGDGEAKDVRVNLKNMELTGVKSTYLGRISSGENIPARFILTSKEAKIYPFEVEVQYKSNTEIKTSTFPLEVQVFPAENPPYLLYAVGAIALIVIYVLFKLLKKLLK